MHRSIYTAVGLAVALTGAGCSSLQTQGLQAVSEASGADNIKSTEFSGTGRWYQFGQAPNPDLSWPQFESFAGKRTIEIHSIAASGHNDAFVLVYLPKEKILVEADAYTPTAANVPPPAKPNPYSVNLYRNIQKLKLDVGRIAALHGPRVVTLADLRNAIGQPRIRAKVQGFRPDLLFCRSGLLPQECHLENG
jgi:glyoxylase-like metal-dependent hydrolase (beta-lactamase superfamily II)